MHVSPKNVIAQTQKWVVMAMVFYANINSALDNLSMHQAALSLRPR